MKKWMSVLLSAVILCGCGKAEEQPKEERKQEVDKKPNIEVKVKPPKEEQLKKEKKQPKKDKNKKNQKAKQVETKSEEKPTNISTTPVQTVPSFDTERYNLARYCLITPGKEKEVDCQEIGDTPEYSKAWNNLTSEGYICQSGQCNPAHQPVTEEEKVVEQKEPMTTEQKNSVPIETQVIPAKPVKDKTTESVEPKKTEVKTSTQPVESKATTKSSTTSKATTNPKLNTTVQDNKDADN